MVISHRWACYIVIDTRKQSLAQKESSSPFALHTYYLKPPYVSKMPFKATVAKFVRRKLQPAKGCDESYIVEDEAAVLRADIEKRMRDENFRIETHFTWVDLNPDERDSFRALFGKRGRP